MEREGDRGEMEGRWREREIEERGEMERERDRERGEMERGGRW